MMELANVELEARDRSTTERRALLAGWIPLIALPPIVTMFRARFAPWQFMWALSIATFFGCKWETWFRARLAGVHASFARNFGYLLLWPGMDARTFLSADKISTRPGVRDWLAVTAKTLLGCSLVWLAARNAVKEHSLAVGWIGMIGIVLALHFGLFHLIALAWQAAGVPARPIMQSPVRATSLSEFWGKRWNIGFRHLTHGIVFRPVRKRVGTAAATLAAFFISGLIHDFVISFPAGGGYGLPTCYFLLQGFGVLVERSKLGVRLGMGGGFRGWLFTLACASGPAFWLFHPRFVRVVMLPFFAWIGRL
jgi:hypothetical protein